MQSNQEKLTNWFNALQSKASASIATAFANSRTKDSRLIIEGKSKLSVGRVTRVHRHDHAGEIDQPQFHFHHSILLCGQ
jgi:hypothetical protein